MKKFFLALIASLAVFSFIACDNGMSGGSLQTTEPENNNSYLELSNTNNGIIIKLPLIPTGANRCSITRTNLTKNTVTYITIEDLNSYKETTVTDNYVNLDDKYEYTLEYINTNNNWTRVYKSNKTLIPNNGIALGGIGDFNLTVTPKAIFNQNNGTLTFTTLPKVSTNVESSFKDPEYLNMYIAYSHKGGYWAFSTPIKQNINLKEIDSKLHDENLYFQSLDIFAYKNGIKYSTSYSASKINNRTENIRSIINLNGIKGTLEISNASNGITLKLPTISYPIDRCEITRKNLTKNTETIIKTKDFYKYNGKSIIDLYVNSNEKYEYKVKCFDSNGNSWYNSEYTPISNNGVVLNGLGELLLDTLPKASYDETLAKLTFQTLPDYSEAIKNSIIQPNDIKKFYISYKNEKSNKVFEAPLSATINLREFIDLSNYEQEFHFNEIRYVVIKDNLYYEGTYNQSYINPNTNSANIPLTIKVSHYNGPVTTITVLDYASKYSSYINQNQNMILDAFEKSHPNIKIEREVLFDSDFHQKTAQYVQSGTMPDVFFMWPEGRSALIHDNKLAKNLKPFLERDGILNDYKETCVDPTLQRSGYVAEIPIGLSTTSCMFVNKKVLNACGINAPATTYEELKEQVKILESKGKKGIIMANQDDWVMQSCLFSLVLGRFGGKEWAKDIKSGKITFATYEPFKKAVQFIKQMYDDGVMTQESLMTPYGEVPGYFASEQGGYLIDGDWRVGAFLTDLSTGNALIPIDKQKSDIELIQFPAIPGEVCKASNSGTLGYGYGMSSSILAGSAKEDAAWELIKWLSGPTVQQIRLDTGESFPSLKEEKLNFSKLEPLVRKRSKFYGLTKNLTPVFDSVINSNVAKVLNAQLQLLGLGLSSVDDVITAVDQAYNAHK